MNVKASLSLMVFGLDVTILGKPSANGKPSTKIDNNTLLVLNGLVHCLTPSMCSINATTVTKNRINEDFLE